MQKKRYDRPSFNLWELIIFFLYVISSFIFYFVLIGLSVSCENIDELYESYQKDPLNLIMVISFILIMISRFIHRYNRSERLYDKLDELTKDIEEITKEIEKLKKS